MNKFEDIMSGKVTGLSSDQIKDALKETICGFNNLKDINDFLIKLHPSDAYRAIRDFIQPKTNKIVRAEQREKSDEYARFQNITQEAKKVFDYEHKHASIFEVHQITESAVQRVYGILVRMISKVDDELGRVEHAVNTIEGHLGLGVTKFEEECNNNDTAKTDDEQRSEEVTE